MRRRLFLLFGSATLLLSAFVLAPIASAGDPCFHEMDNRPAPTTASTSSVAIADCVFLPTVTRVPVGTTVTWHNKSFQEHEVVGSNLTWGAHDKLLSPGDTIGWSFAQPGIYAYSCMIHPGMTGVVVVGDAATASAAGPVQDASGDEPPSGAGATSAIIPFAAGGSLVALLGLGLLMVRRRTDAAHSEA